MFAETLSLPGELNTLNHRELVTKGFSDKHKDVYGIRPQYLPAYTTAKRRASHASFFSRSFGYAGATFHYLGTEYIIPREARDAN